MYFLVCANYMQLIEKAIVRDYYTEPVQELNSRAQHNGMYNGTSKEKHSLTRKLVGYRNWRQWHCKKKGNKVLRKRVMRQKSYI